MKRANSWLGIYGVVASTHKELFRVHRDTLVNASISFQAVVVQLHELVGGGADLYSKLSMGYIEGCEWYLPRVSYLSDSAIETRIICSILLTNLE